MKKISPNNEVENLCNRGYSSKQIAEILCLSTRQITLYKDKNKLYSSKFGVLELTDDQKQVILGSILGDGTIEINNKKYNYHRLTIEHSKKQEEYIKFKYNIIKELSDKVRYRLKKDKRKGFKDTEQFILRTKIHPLFSKYRDNWYPNGVKAINKIEFSKIEKLGLAIWFMDDGYRNGNSITIATQSFLRKDIIWITNFLKQKWGLKFTIWRDGQIGLLIETYPIFYKLINDIIIPEMRYKLPKVK